jgi:hypothetical protein
MFVTRAVFHGPMSWLKAVALWNMFCRRMLNMCAQRRKFRADAIRAAGVCG